MRAITHTGAQCCPSKMRTGVATRSIATTKLTSRRLQALRQFALEATRVTCLRTDGTGLPPTVQSRRAPSAHRWCPATVRCLNGTWLGLLADGGSAARRRAGHELLGSAERAEAERDSIRSQDAG